MTAILSIENANAITIYMVKLCVFGRNNDRNSVDTREEILFLLLFFLQLHLYRINLTSNTTHTAFMNLPLKSCPLFIKTKPFV